MSWNAYHDVEQSGRDEARHLGIEDDRPTAWELEEDGHTDDGTVTRAPEADVIDVKLLRAHPRSVTSRRGLTRIVNAWRIFRNGTATGFMVVRCAEGLAIVDSNGRKVTEWAQDGRTSPLALAKNSLPRELFG